MRLHNRTASYLTITDKLTVYPHNSTELTEELMKLQSVQYFINSGMAEVLKEGQAGTTVETPKIIKRESVTASTLEDTGIILEAPLTVKTVSELVDEHNYQVGASDTDLESIEMDVDNEEAGAGDFDKIDAEKNIADDAGDKFKHMKRPTASRQEVGTEVIPDGNSFIKKASLNAVGAMEFTDEAQLAKLEDAAAQLKTDIEGLTIDGEDMDKEIVRFNKLDDYQQKKYIINCEDSAILKKIYESSKSKNVKELIIQRQKELN